MLHIELRRWADLLLIAPLDANTLAKLAAGLADNCLTCVWRAWDPARPVVLAPAMNTLMWQHPLTARRLRQLAARRRGAVRPAGHARKTIWSDWINAHCPRLRVVPRRKAGGWPAATSASAPWRIRTPLSLLSIPSPRRRTRTRNLDAGRLAVFLSMNILPRSHSRPIPGVPAGEVSGKTGSIR